MSDRFIGIHGFSPFLFKMILLIFDTLFHPYRKHFLYFVAGIHSVSAPYQTTNSTNLSETLLETGRVMFENHDLIHLRNQKRNTRSNSLYQNLRPFRNQLNLKHFFNPHIIVFHTVHNKKYIAEAPPEFPDIVVLEILFYNERSTPDSYAYPQETLLTDAGHKDKCNPLP